MESKRNWKLRYWIIGGYAVPVLALLISAGATIVNINTVNQRSENLLSSYDINSILDDLSVSVQSSSKANRSYLLEKNQQSFESYQKAQKDSKEFLAKLMTLARSQEERQSLTKLEELLNKQIAFDDNLMARVDRGKVKEAVESWSQGNSRNQGQDVVDMIGEMQQREDQTFAIAAKEQQEALNALKFTVMLSSGLSLVVSVLIGIWVINRTARQMNASASAIATSTTEIATTIEQQERATIQQATSVNQTTTTMDELAASSRQSAEQAEASAAGAQQVLLLVDGRTQEGQFSQSSLREKVGDIATQILHLSEQTNQIGTISTLVSDLASQTNMLALNAAVEAVRAGEHGKGFAVVAAEIRKLADQSKRSAEKINLLVLDIQKSTNSTVMVTDEGTKTVEKIVDAIKTIALNGQQISLTSNQQAIAVLQVVEAMNSLNISARETASGISQIKVGTQRLNDAAQELKAVV
ncbi:MULTISPECIES: methyl-accepting chemotaxis protein [unclassified Nostoc]|uniref:HAMP domain-containing methyl-accepting chemotaxis protein n=1 Tax=unclassified Nostoc TaxID=2593658 RepID=UPI002AD3D424|nr:methyl-accepting chemotaxis protein [Nostoc sp. DedQUE03]MDZ7971468.1 methyl-accepting chemotaxis protein [Nostoc sp. DedQUE03]MDZ8046260.1 methyl-accepting chemotaxis protein [Nostoc sp. DedQUE02]